MTRKMSRAIKYSLPFIFMASLSWGARIHGGSGSGSSSVSISTLTTGATNFIWNDYFQNIYQSSSSFHVTSGTIRDMFIIGPRVPDSGSPTTNYFLILPANTSSGDESNISLYSLRSQGIVALRAVDETEADYTRMFLARATGDPCGGQVCFGTDTGVTVSFNIDDSKHVFSSTDVVNQQSSTPSIVGIVGETAHLGQKFFTLQDYTSIGDLYGSVFYRIDRSSVTSDINAVFNSTMTLSGGRVMAITAPADGQVVAWSASNNRWQPGTVATSGGGSLVIKRNDTAVDVSVSTIDFAGNDFGVTSSPSGEANVVLSTFVARSTVTVTAGVGMTGGGTLLSNFSIGLSTPVVPSFITVALSTLTSGATNFIFNQSAIQTGAIFNVSSAAVQNLFTTVSSMTISGNRLVAMTAPSDTQVLQWSSSNNRWQPGSVITSTPTVSLSTLTAGATNFIFNQSFLQSGATFYVSSGSVQNLFTAVSSMTLSNSRLVSMAAPSDAQVLQWSSSNNMWQPGSVTATVVLSTTTAGATNYIFNQSILQSGATFYVSSGTAGSFTADTVNINNLTSGSIPYINSSKRVSENTSGLRWTDGGSAGGILTLAYDSNGVDDTLYVTGDFQNSTVGLNILSTSAMTTTNTSGLIFGNRQNGSAVEYATIYSITTDTVNVSGKLQLCATYDQVTDDPFISLNGDTERVHIYKDLVAGSTASFQYGLVASTVVISTSIVIKNLGPGVMHVLATSSRVVTGQVSLSTEVTGVLPIANGGTNNSAAYTGGAVIFADGTKLTEDSSNFYYDNSANSLAIRNVSPSAALHVEKCGGEDSSNFHGCMQVSDFATSGFNASVSIGVGDDYGWIQSRFVGSGDTKYPLMLNGSGGDLRMGSTNYLSVSNAKLGIYQDLSGPLTLTNENVIVLSAAGNYDPGDDVIYRIYAYKTVGNVKFFSPTYLQTTVATAIGNDAFEINFTDPDTADGYLAIRDYNGDGYASYYDAGNANPIIDDKDATVTWTSGTPLTTPRDAGWTYHNWYDGSYFWGSYGGMGYFSGPVGIRTQTPVAPLTIESDSSSRGIQVYTTEHSSLVDSEISVRDSLDDEVIGLAAWNGGLGSAGYGTAVFSSECNTAGCYMGELSGRNTTNGTRVADIIFQQGSAADTGRITMHIGRGGGAFATDVFAIASSGTRWRVGVGITPGSLTDLFHLAAGGTTDSPIRFTSGSLTTGSNIRAGQMSYLTDKAYLVLTSTVTHKEFTLNDVALTSGRVPFITTNGRLSDSSQVTYSTTTQTMTLTAAILQSTVTMQANQFSVVSATQTIGTGTSISANACGGFKRIFSTFTVTTDTTNTFASGTPDGCEMTIVNVGTNTITLDFNANFKSNAASDVVMTGTDTVKVGTINGIWWQLTTLNGN